MPRRAVIAEISEDEDDRIDIQTTPTPSASEDEDQKETLVGVVKGKTESSTVQRPAKEDVKEKPAKKPLSEERLKKLEVMRQARKRKLEDAKEAQAILFLKDRGFAIDDKKSQKDKETKQAIHLQAKPAQAKQAQSKQAQANAQMQQTPIVNSQAVIAKAPVLPAVQNIKPTPAHKKYPNPWAE